MYNTLHRCMHRRKNGKIYIKKSGENYMNCLGTP